MAVAWLAMLGMGWMVRSIVARVPPEWERRIGAEVLEELRGELQFVKDTNRVARLTAAAKPLLQVHVPVALQVPLPSHVVEARQ